MTFALVARCADTGMFGTAVASSSPAVAARCSHVRTGVGAVSSQNVTDPTLGPKILDMMGDGLSSFAAIAELNKTGKFMEYRQVLAIDCNGLSTIHSGQNVLGIWAEAQDADVASAGNLLANEMIPKSMIEAFLAAKGHLGDRLLTALRAGLTSGGEEGPIRSAGVKIVDRVTWPAVDLRCDWTENCPITELESAWLIYKPQIADYIDRAINPGKALPFTVPGNQ